MLQRGNTCRGLKRYVLSGEPGLIAWLRSREVPGSPYTFQHTLLVFRDVGIGLPCPKGVAHRIDVCERTHPLATEGEIAIQYAVVETE